MKLLYDSEWTVEMEMTLKDFQKECVICGSTERLTVDHVRPISKGNGLKPGNAVVLCMHHNCNKQAKDLEQLPSPIASLLLEEAMHFNVYWDMTHARQN